VEHVTVLFTILSTIGSLPLVRKQFKMVTHTSPRNKRRIIRNNQGPNTQGVKRNESFTTINTVPKEIFPNSVVQTFKKLREYTQRNWQYSLRALESYEPEAFRIF